MIEFAHVPLRKLKSAGLKRLIIVSPEVFVSRG